MQNLSRSACSSNRRTHSFAPERRKRNTTVLSSRFIRSTSAMEIRGIADSTTADSGAVYSTISAVSRLRTTPRGCQVLNVDFCAHRRFWVKPRFVIAGGAR